jgi:hypothetical protein
LAQSEKGKQIMKAKKKAPASTEARKNKTQKEAYPKAATLSSLKLSSHIGQLLLLLLIGNEQPDGWQRFDQLLRQFYEGDIL